MYHIPHGAMPGAFTPIEKAPGALNTEGLTTDSINDMNFATDNTQRQAILTALTKLIDPPYVFGFRPLPTKNRQRLHAIHDLGLGDFLVYTNKKTVYCKDLQAVQAFAQKLGATK
jgi:hypothetical protein